MRIPVDGPAVEPSTDGLTVHGPNAQCDCVPIAAATTPVVERVRCAPAAEGALNVSLGAIRAAEMVRMHALILRRLAAAHA